jgi:hypothetical protein
MDNVFTITPKSKVEEERKNSLLEVLDNIRDQIESGQIKELVAATMDQDGLVQIHVSVLDLAGGVGLFEIGKSTLIQSQS